MDLKIEEKTKSEMYFISRGRLKMLELTWDEGNRFFKSLTQHGPRLALNQARQENKKIQNFLKPN